MKLKSKLIATIVSICAAIAVMGVGVWAATSTFSVSVSNTVNLTFQNLDGMVEVSASATADKYAAGAAAINLNSTEIFNNGVTAYNAVSSSETAAGTNLQFLGADFFTNANIDAATKNAAVMYEFKYTHNANAASGAVAVTVTETAAPAVTGATITVSYYVSTDNTNWTKATVGQAYTTTGHTGDIYVRAIAQYTNANGVSVTTTGTTWNFAVAYEAVATVGTTPSGTTTISTNANGVVTIA